MDCIFLLDPDVGGKAKILSVFGRTATGGARKALAITGRMLVRFQGAALGAGGAFGGPFGNGISGVPFVFWKAAISHLPACFRRVSV